MLCYFFCVKKVTKKTRFFEEKAPQKPFASVKREVYALNYGVS